jgi:hypothetical protein
MTVVVVVGVGDVEDVVAGRAAGWIDGIGLLVTWAGFGGGVAHVRPLSVLWPRYLRFCLR